ncbi:MAG: tetratricopeptide repeat protein [Vicinamibacterales bacterium]
MRRLLPLVAVLALVLPRAAAADWLSLRSDHFQVVGNAGEGELRNVALKLEQFRDVIGQLNPAALREGAPPVVVLVFRDKRSYEPFMPLANGRIIPVSGFFQPGQDVNYITLTLEEGDRGFPIIFHEYSHLLLNGIFAHAPLWFNEGLAEYYSTFEASTRSRANIGKAVLRHLELLRSRRLPFARFFAIDRNSPEYTRDITDRDVLYAQSWAIVHHAFHGESKRRDQLLAFVTKLAEGGATEESFRAAYGIEVRDLEREVQLYVQKTAHTYMAYTFPDNLVTRIESRTTRIADAEADAWLGDLLAHMNRNEEATARLEKALAAKQDLALAHASLGRLQIRGGKTGEGMAHLRQAQTLGTANETVYFAYAYELIRQQGSQDADSLQQASRALERAIALRPGYTEAKLLLGFTYSATGEYAASRDLLTPLVRAEPANHRAALQLGEALLRLNDLDGARAVLGPVLARATDAAEKERARTLLGVSAGLQTRRDTLAAAGVSAPPALPILPAGGGAPPRSSAGNAASPTFTPALRPVGPGEQRVYGVFAAVECGQNGVVLVVRTATGQVRARAAGFADVDFIAYRALTTMSVSCGAQVPPMEVYLTSRLPPGSNAGAEGTAVALEILPEGFVPER